MKDAVAIADSMATKKLVNSEGERQTGEYWVFVYALEGSEILPHGIHLSRDSEWPLEAQSSVPEGHQTFNSTYGEIKGVDFISKLEQVNSAFGECIAGLTYECECATSLSEWVLKRTEIQNGKDWPEAWENEIEQYAVVVPRKAEDVM
jgi:hypothetical protein